MNPIKSAITGADIPAGHLHPITQFVREVSGIFAEMGFVVAEGPELEQEFYNFDALNVPADHPSRDMQDTFWVKERRSTINNTQTNDIQINGKQNDEMGALNKQTSGEQINSQRKSGRPVMRTQTSSVQIRFLEKHKDSLPCAIIVPGKVFRNEATDATHEAQFYQLEALYVDKDVSMGHLKGTIEHFLKKLYGDDVEIRLRPSFFPFVEPGVEVDMKFNGKWLEMGGAGLVHPNVFKAVGIDPLKWKGFAFGFGVDRLVMRRHNITDIRLLYNGDLRFAEQF
ncbi:MAG: phenylalanine--tRNA ligase subunit alpha [Candidatus Taylorbacteria bacterium]|nr:phenylalanine--tRNA ligase subunit alpha [Candidatus Taylorbacteria bacterium]